MRQFEQHYIKKNHSKAMPNRIIYFDTETEQDSYGDEQLHRFKIGWSCYVETRQQRDKDTEVWEYWDDPYAFCAYLQNKCKQKTTLTIIGHNIFYDLQVSRFFHYFTLWGWKLRFVYNKGLTYILVIHKDKAVLRALSTTNWFQTSLKNLGDMVGLQKLDVDFQESTPEELSIYCKRDVEIVKLAVEKYMSFLVDNDMGKFAMSRAGQSYAAFRHRFMNTKICVHQEQDISDFERMAYYGGRVECFRIGKQNKPPYVSVDVNSLYPFVMRTYQYPTRLVDYVKYPDMEMLTTALNNRAIVAEVILRTDEPAYPVRQNKKIIYPIGTFKTYVCTQGLRYALDHGHLKDVLCASYYEKDWIFQDFVNYFYELRNHYKGLNNREYEQFCKYILNSLYGKFGQKTTLEEIREDITFDGYSREIILDGDTGEREIVTKLFNTVVTQYGEKTAKHALVAIAAHVTEYGRFHLWKLMNEVGRERVLYCDTDSMTLRKCHLKYLKNSLSDTELGALKLEHTYNFLVLNASKDYETDISIKRKGVPKSAECLDDNTFRYTQWCKQETHLRRAIDDRYITKTVTKRLSRKYDKGIVNANGSVDPFVLNLID